MIIMLLPLLLIGAVIGVVSWARSRKGTATTAPAQSSSSLDEFAFAAEMFLLGVFTAVAVSGAAGLLTRLFDTIAGETISDVATAVARAISFVVIAGPLSAVMWRRTWKRNIADLQASVVWSVFLSVSALVALLVWSISGLGALRDVATGEFDRSGFAIAIVWFGAWLVLRWVQRRSSRQPVVLTELAAAFGSVVGIALVLRGATALLAALWSLVLGEQTNVISAGSTGATENLFGWLLYVVAAGLIWWLHFIHDNARRNSTVLPGLLNSASGIVAPAIMTLTGVGMLLYQLIRWVSGTELDVVVLDPSPGAGLALALVGGTVWAYYYPQLSPRVGTTAASPASTASIAIGDAVEFVARVTRLVLSGVGLIGAATGLGIVVNAGLGAFVATIGGSGMSDLLAGGFSVLIVSAPLWVVAWQPAAQLREPEQQHWHGRQIYLVIVFSVAAIIALITTIVIAYTVIEYLLRTGAEEGLLDEVRTSLGLLVATGVVAGYHFPVWQRGRAVEVAHTASTASMLQTVILIVPSGTDANYLNALVGELRTATPTQVLVWRRTDHSVPLQPAGAGLGGVIAQSLQNVQAPRALVVMEDAGSYSVIPLEP